MTREEFAEFLKYYRSKNYNPYCDLRFHNNDNEEKILIKIMSSNSIAKDVRNHYFPKSLKNICDLNFIYYENHDYSIKSLLTWGTELVEAFSEEAATFLLLKNNYEKALFSEKYDLALRILDEIEKKICCSLWTTYQKFLVLNFLKQGDSILDTINKLQNSTYTNFALLLIYYYSKMTDQTVVFEEFNTNIRQLLESGYKSNVGWKYINYKLNITEPKEIQGIKCSLVFDEQISFIDYYETYIDAIQILSGQERYSEIIKVCVKSLYQRINDFRLRNIYASLFNVDDNIILDENACNLIEDYTQGNYNDLINKIEDYLKVHPNNFEICNLLMKIGIENEKIVIPHSNFWIEVNNIYQFKYDIRKSTSIIGNYYKLFYGTSWKYKILSIMVRKLNYNYNSNILHISMMNDSIFTPLFYQCIKSNEEKVSYIEKFNSFAPVTSELILYMIKGEIDKNTIEKIDPIRWKYYEIQSFIKEGDLPNSIEKCCQILDNSNEIEGKRYYQERIRRTLYNCYLAVGDLEKVMNLYVDSFLIIEELVVHMNLKNLIYELNDDNDNEIKGNVCRPIIFSLYYKSSIDEVLPSYLDYIENQGYKTVKQLLEKYINLHEKDILFLNKVCSQSLLMKDYVSKSEYNGSAAELRAEVLKVLINLDKKSDRMKEYLHELNSIYKATQLQRKINSFNHNRIFIDTENLFQYLCKDLENEFLKYKTVQELKNIVITKTGKKEELERIISFVSEQYWDQQRFFQSMAEKIKKEYLYESPFALECFLSTRIRHNFCNDNLKRTFETEKIFSKKMKDDSADYIINDYWKNKLSDEEYNLITEALSRFSQSIDLKIQEIKDKWMRIKLDESNEGLFDYGIFEEYLANYWIFDKTLLNDVAGFYQFIIGELNYSTGRILEELRDKIDKDLKPYYDNSLEELGNSIKFLEFDGTVKSEMIRCIELSKAKYIEDIEAFKDILIMEYEKYPNFTMDELIEFCYEIEKEMNNKFCNVKVKTEIKIKDIYYGGIFPYLVDIIGILIRNAVEHSKIQNLEDLHLGIKIDSFQGSKIREKINSKLENTDGIIVFSVSNNLSLSADEEIIKSKISEKINNIYSGKYNDKSSQEGGSGLYKIARTIYYSLNSPMEYYYELEGGVFEISIATNLSQFLRKDFCDQ